MSVLLTLQVLILYLLTLPLLAYLTASIGYLLVLAAAYFLIKEPSKKPLKRNNRFALLIPAHNEELLVGRLCHSLLSMNYPAGCYEIFVVLDNCTDKTADVCRPFPVRLLTRNDPSRKGKGYALQWALEQIPLESFDAVLIIDADNLVDRNLLRELNVMLNRGEQAIQCHNAVGNSKDSWFTQLLFVSRTIGNLLYHHSKYKLGFTSYLMGNGVCIRTSLLKRKGWTAFSIGEDWEYYAQLVADHIRIGFAKEAKVFHQESKSLNQATSQRLRWSSGRFRVARTLGLRLLGRGLRTRDLFLVDASLPLIFPNYSLQVNLTIVALMLCLAASGPSIKTALIIWCLLLLGGQCFLFAAGVFLVENRWAVLNAILNVPVFLLWKSIIDFLSFTGIYRGDKWVRTARHLPVND